MDYGEETASEGSYYNDRTSLAKEVSRKESPVEREIQALSKSVIQLSAEMDSLEQKLSGVLQNIPESGNKTGEPEEGLSPVPDEIRRQRHMVQNVNYRLRSILKRIEL